MKLPTLAGSLLIASLLAGPAQALEVRKWTLITGQIIEGELVRPDGENVIIKDKSGRPAPFELSKLSFADREYIKEYAPKDNKAGFAPAKPVVLKTPYPAKEVKIDKKLQKKADKIFELQSDTFAGWETPHFVVMYNGKDIPTDIAETAERLWFDFNFLHPSFEQLFEGRKMAIFLMEEGEAFDELGEWLVQQMVNGGQGVRAAEFAKSWKVVGASPVPLPDQTAQKYGLLKTAQMIKKATKGEARQKGVLVPFHIHVLSSAMLDMVAGGGTSGFAADGSFALLEGFPFFKEIQIAGKSETAKLNVDDDAKNKKDEVTNTGVLGDMRQVAKDTEALVKKNSISLADLYKLSRETNVHKEGEKPAGKQKLTRSHLLLAHAFARFLNKDTHHMECFSKLMKQVGTSNQLPVLEDLAKEYGYADVPAMEKAFQEYIAGPEFKKQ